jgi:glycosyltransferase involved in cell wall biosynthesis
MKILIISSLSPYKSANYGKYILDSLLNAGHEVHFLTKWKYNGMSENMFSIYDDFKPSTLILKNSFKTKVKKILINKIPNLLNLFRKKEIKQSVITSNEENPEVEINLLLNNINYKYDFVFIIFWQFMLNTKSIKHIYNKLKCPIFLNVVDMFPMTGGCYYFSDCENYKFSCLSCPVSNLFENTNVPNYNFNYKKNVYDEINCVYLCNTWMKDKVIKSGIISNDKIKLFNSPVNLDYFKLRDKFISRNILNLPKNKYILFAGAANLELKRKGFSELIKAVNDFINNIDNPNDIILVLAGCNDKDIQHLFNLKVINFGFVNTKDLAYLYSSSDLYLSPSIDDAGPSMIVQSLTCGTPVVSFNIGEAVDVIKSGINGYLAEVGDFLDFSNGIKLFYNMDENVKINNMSHCSKIMEKRSNPQTIVNFLEQLYQEYNK